MKEILNDTLDKKSSKRLAGLSCIGAGLLVGFLVIVLDATGSNLTVRIVEVVIGSILTTGAALLGISVAEKFSKNVKNKNK